MSSHDEPKVHKAYKVVVSMYYNVLQERNNKCMWINWICVCVCVCVCCAASVPVWCVCVICASACVYI